jgi:putative ABC transport system substrate-binding protein
LLISRRAFVASVTGGLLSAPLAAGAQPARKVHRIGFLGNSTAALEANLVQPFRDGLRELGYVEGRDVAIEYRWAEGQYERFPALVAELIALKVEVLVTAGTPAALAVKRATTTIPLVMVAVGEPVGTGLVKSLARPGGNLTGLVSIAPDLKGSASSCSPRSCRSFRPWPSSPIPPIRSTRRRRSRRARRPGVCT